MRIALCSSSVPFVGGGYRNIVDWTAHALQESGHDVDRVYIPELDEPSQLVRQLIGFRWIDLESADRIICFRPMSYIIPHPNKVVWFIHHLRTFYDLWDSEYRFFPADGKHVRLQQYVRYLDAASLQESRLVYSNSQVVADRLKAFNGIDSEVLYPPVMNPERFGFEGLNDEIVCISRIEHHKRQHLLVDAMRYVTTPVRLGIYGLPGNDAYQADLLARVAEHGLHDRVTIHDRWISEQEKASILGSCLGLAYVPVDEDSYGYPSLEAAHSRKACLTTSDAGGVLEFVRDGDTGLVGPPEAQSIAEMFDRMYLDRSLARDLGSAAHERIGTLGISWDRVVGSLLA